MSWVRQISLVKRVVIGYSMIGSCGLGLGCAAAWAAQQTSGGSALAGTFLALTLLSTVLAVLAASLTVSSIKNSVEPTVHCVMRVASGDLETKIESPGKDEISWLRSELNSMRKKLRAMVLEVCETVNHVGSATAEIANGNSDLSARTESQVGSLAQTVGSMQQLATSVQDAARHAEEARTMVTDSSHVAERGAKTMLEVVERMGEINHSANRIGEIIGVIDGIAFQTNILALNAAVEAARAGEHGRGFAVVAAEVRALAQRSSTAAREIKTLIGDSSARVEAGSKLVNEAGETMQEILSSVQRVSHLIGTIANASRTQGQGIVEVNRSIEQFDQVTQQNAALVEQLSAAAQSLKKQSSRLSESIGSFQVVA